MKSQLVKSLLLSALIGSTLTACNKEQSVQPESAAATVTSNVQVINGRLVFADQQSFEQVRAALGKQAIDAGSNEVQELNNWEKNLKFTSLRATAATQASELEALEAQKQPTAEYDLMTSFGFPAFYATLINPAGEYQIGSKVYWFHDGNKYEAASEAELAAIKQSPATAKIKYVAGTKLLKSTALAAGQTARTIGSRNPQDDYKYHYEFPLRNDAGSQRRIMYNIRIYVEDRGTNPGLAYARQFYTNLSLLIKYEYYSFGNGAWYPSTGRGSQLNWSTAITFTGTPLTPNPLSTPVSYSNNSYRSFSFDNGVVGISLGDATIYANVGMRDYSINDVTWDYQIGGNISSYPNDDPSHFYTVDNSVLW